MTAQELQKKHDKLVEEIYSFAEQNGLCKKNPVLQPVPDGVVCAEKYLASNPKIMWILKEPYDEITASGKSKGGEWSITEAMADDTKRWAKYRTITPIVYATYGIFTGEKWAKMPYAEEISDTLLQIAYINVGKMPAHTISSYSDIKNKYKLWKGILLKQIELYNPDVLIFGNTFQYFKTDLLDKRCSCRNYKGWVDAYAFKGKLYLDCYHPSNRHKDKDKYYVDTIVTAYKKWETKYK